jgi:hypothetical protein
MDMLSFFLNICRWPFVNPENLDCCYFGSLGKNLFETNFIVVVFRLCHGRLCFDGMPLIDLWLVGFVLQLGKIVAGIEQKPVSLNDIVTCRALIKNERDY